MTTNRKIDARDVEFVVADGLFGPGPYDQNSVGGDGWLTGWTTHDRWYGTNDGNGGDPQQTSRDLRTEDDWSEMLSSGRC